MTRYKYAAQVIDKNAPNGAGSVPAHGTVTAATEDEACKKIVAAIDARGFELLSATLDYLD